jgi:PAS domain S-box-containing protein
MSELIRVLYIDDNPADLELVCAALEKKHGGFKVTTAATRQQFETYLHQDTFDLVLSDFNILGYTGLEVLGEVQKYLPLLPVVLVTGTGSEEIAIEALKSGAADYVIKTSDHIKRLPYTLLSVLEGKRLQLETTQTQEKLLRSEERLKLALSGADLGMWDWNLVTGELAVDHRWVEMLGYRLGELEQNSALWQKLVHPDDLQRLGPPFHAHLKGETPLWDAERRLLHKSGDWIWIQVRAKVTERDAAGKPLRMTGTHLNISERKQAELELKLERDKLKSIFSRMVDGVYIINSEYELEYVNPVLANDFGYFEGKKCHKYLHDLDQVCSWCRSEEIERGKSIRWEWSSDRSDKTYDMISTPLQNADGSISRLEIFRDVTDKKLVEKEREKLVYDMRERVKELRCMHNVNEAIRSGETLANVLKKVTSLIPAGWQYPEITRCRIRFDEMEFVSQTFEDSSWSLTREIFVDGQFRGIIEVYYLEARPDSYAGVFLSEECDLLDSISRSLSEAIEHHLLMESQSHLYAAIEQASEVVVITDTAGVIEYVNPAFELVTGFSRKEALGQNPRVLKSDRHDDSFYRELWDTINRGKAWHGHFVNQKKDGSLYEEEATISPVFAKTGKITNFVAVKRDVTHERQLEKQLLQSQKLEAVGQLAGGVAHDFNNILQVMTGHTDFALRPDVTEEERIEDLDIVRESIDKAAALTRQLLAFSRRQVLEPSNLDPNELIDKLLKMIRRLIGEDISLQYDPCNDLCMVNADAGQLEQVIINLCVNARDAMDSGGLLKIKTEETEIGADFLEKRPWAKPGPYVLISVADSGFGMDEATLEQIFEPFFTTKPEGKGTGLGLATVYGIVKQHEGMIIAYSEPGKGSTFKVYLPKVGRVESIEEVEADMEVKGGDETILLAEDNDDVRKSISLILEEAGYQVITAVDGAEAIKIYEEKTDNIDLALLDVVMPEAGGREVHDRIREITPGAKVLFSSGYSEDAIHTRFVLDRDMELIRKPYNAKDLLQRLRQLLDEGGETADS